MSLTDDWKAGKLRTGYYFVRLLEGYVTVAYFNGLDILICPSWEIVEVLAPCDYEELLRLKEENKYAKLLLPRIDELLQKVRDNETSRN